MGEVRCEAVWLFMKKQVEKNWFLLVLEIQRISIQIFNSKPNSQS